MMYIGITGQSSNYTDFLVSDTHIDISIVNRVSVIGLE